VGPLAGHHALAGAHGYFQYQPQPSPTRTPFTCAAWHARPGAIFDDLVGPDTHWLPPDNSQLSLHVEVAQRTSPTNIGLWLTSALAARDLGYLTADDLLTRCSNTMATLNSLERYEGHLLNWYDTSTLAPLAPRYVSTVDSGNLIASLWVLEQGCREALRAPLIDRACLRGLSDTISVLVETRAAAIRRRPPRCEALRRFLHGKPEGHELVARLRLAPVPCSNCAIWGAGRIRRARSAPIGFPG
jgi:hypothetical protein